MAWGRQPCGPWHERPGRGQPRSACTNHGLCILRGPNRRGAGHETKRRPNGLKPHLQMVGPSRLASTMSSLPCLWLSVRRRPCAHVRCLRAQ
eukprot:5226377-Lingulodinium_polyedra.AAC.1